MPRRGRSASPPPAPQRRAAPQQSYVPARAAPATPAPAPAAAMAQPQQPSMFGQMAATAGGVAVGSAVAPLKLFTSQLNHHCAHLNKIYSTVTAQTTTEMCKQCHPNRYNYYGSRGGSRYSRRSQHAPARSPPVVVTPPPRRSMFRDAAAVAGGVTVGTTVGHLAGEAISGMFGGGRRREDVAQSLPQDYNYSQEPSGPCAFEISQFLQCAASHQDLQECQEFNDALRECKRRNRIP